MKAPNGGEILSIIQEICGIGPRWMGTKGAELAVEFITRQFQNSGLSVAHQAFGYSSYSPKKASFLVNGRQVTCEPIALSRSTTGMLTAPLVYGGQCLREDLDAIKARGIEVGGSIVLSENLRSFVAYPHAQAAGAAGFVSLTTLPGNSIRCGCARLDRRPAQIPAIAIGGDDGRTMVKELEGGRSLEAGIEVAGRVVEKEGFNVIGRKSNTLDQRVLVTAHYDSFWNGVHAMDNAVGTATVIALSRYLTDFHGIEFVVFGGEELGFWGSSSYVQASDASLDTIRAIVNLDTFGSNRSQIEIGATPDLSELCRAVAEERHIAVDCWNIPPRAASDQHSFVEKGVPAVWLANCGTDQRYHTPLDVPSEMSAEKIEKVAELACALIQKLL
ncbi:MAG: M28 family metallopeptidase [Desulfobacterales bacterium]